MKIFNYIKDNIVKNNRIFSENKENIYSKNMRNIKRCYVFSIIISAICCLFSIVPALRMIFVFSSVSLVLCSVCFIVSLIFEKKQYPAGISLYLFAFLSFGLVLAFECFNKGISGILFQALIIVVPLFFYVKVDRCISLVTFVTILYCVLVSIFKEKSLLILELFKTIISYFISIFVFAYINDLKFNNLDANNKLKKQAGLDELTKLPNRRTFNLFMAENEDKFSDDNVDVSAIMMDIDWFKFYNDTYGHIQGDVCLEKIANVLNNIAKKNGIFIARFGGEEFVSYIIGKSVEEVDEICKSIVNGVAKLNLKHEKSPFGHVTISAGYATKKLNHLSNSIQLLNSADEALYMAKSSEEKSYKAARTDW